MFDILGDVFEETSLKELLIRAIRFGDEPGERERLERKVDRALDTEHLQRILERNALAQESMDPARLFAVKEEMEKAEARRLQPFFIRSFFMRAFQGLGGSIHPRESDRFEITYVPSSIRERDRQITGRNRRDTTPVVKRYERVCFTKEAVRPEKAGGAVARMVHPGHKSGDGQVISKRLHFVRVEPDGSASFAGWAPHLDLQPLDEADRPRLKPVLDAAWIHVDLEKKALTLAASSLVPEHFQEVASRRIAHVDRTLAAVHDRLSKEIS